MQRKPKAVTTPPLIELQGARTDCTINSVHDVISSLTC